MKRMISHIVAGALMVSCAAVQAEKAFNDPPAASVPVQLSDAELDQVTAGAPWFVWMGVGALAVVAIDAHTDLIGEAGHGCRGVNCNNLP